MNENTDFNADNKKPVQSSNLTFLNRIWNTF